MWTRAAVVLVLCSACIEDVEVPPKAPVLFAVASPTLIAVQKLKGTRPANTAVLQGDQVVVAAGEDTSFGFDVVLAPGLNTFELKTQRASGLKSKGVFATILYEPACPAAVVLTAQPPPSTNQKMHVLTGTKPKGTAVVLDGAIVVPASDATTFTHPLNLPQAEGAYTFAIAARDAKGHDSDPVRFTVAYDVTPPQLLARFPDAAMTAVPTGASVFLAFSEPVRSTTGMIAADLVTVGTLAGTTAYAPGASAMVWTAAAALPPSTQLTAKLDPALLTDLAGNAVPAGAMWTWTFTTGAGPSAAVPAAPVATTPATTSAPEAVVDGTREIGSAIYVNGDLAVIPGPAPWTVKVPVTVGPNALAVTARTASGVPSATAVTLPVTRTIARPAAPTLDPATPKSVTQGTLALAGTKPAGTGVLLNGVPVACLDDQTTWGAVANLGPGFNDLKLTTRDATGAESDPPLVFTVNFTQGYVGKVPSGWQLKVSMTLRDLRGTRLANEFVTGANNYGVDVWLEGPVLAGEVCEMDAVKKQRKNVKYVATIEHYLGVKTGHTVPFADDDYRGTDYIAALASGGVLQFLGITADTPRRDGNGRETAGLLGAIKESDLRQKIDCFGLLGIDGCTEATVGAGTHVVDAWEPKRPPNATPIEQGDYLLWVQINLDRGGTWLTSNDTETCWSQPADFTKGMHRIVYRVALGGSAWNKTLGPGDELAGPDSDGSGEARFLAAEGMTVSWGPP